MVCPHCGKENAQVFTYCDSCGRALTSAPRPAPAPSATTSPAAVVTAPKAASVTQAMDVHKKRSPTLTAVIVIVVAGVIGGLAFLAANINRETPEQRMGRLMREAAGLEPVHNAFFSKDRQFDDMFRAQFRNLFAVNREFAAFESKINANEIAKVGTPESFVDPDYAAEGIRQLHASYILDTHLQQKVLDIADNLRHAVEVTDWSASRKADALAGFQRGFAASMEKRQRLLDSERAFLDAVDDIDGYAKAHYAEFQLQNGELKITDASLLPDFNAKMSEYNARRSALLQAKQEFDRFQGDMIHKMGMSPKDAGLQ